MDTSGPFHSSEKKGIFEIPARYNRGMRFRLRTLLIVLALGAAGAGGDVATVAQT
jgi:hypothetical protein